jgi:hypothetical protein
MLFSRLLPASSSVVALAIGLSPVAGCGANAGKGSQDSEFDASSSSSPPSVSPQEDGAAAASGSSGSLSQGGSSTPLGSGLVGSSGQGAKTDGSAGGVACPAGLQCDVTCPAGQTTTVTGTVYDPAGKNPIYNVAVYVPATPLQPLPAGVPMGADACSCGALFQSGALSSTSSGVDGTFTLTDVPVGANVPLVIQVGKWRRQFSVPVTACTANALPDRSIALPSTVAGPGDNLPDIAVSTGGSDSLECLMRRIGLPVTEYVAGSGTGGHVHIFSGGRPPMMGGPGGGPGGGGGGPNPGLAENPSMPGAPASDTSLWSTQAQLMPYDIVLLSCEGGETYNANPPALEAYLNAGGRAFGSHFQYAWFGGPIASSQAYAAPKDWGANLATWSIDNSMTLGPIGGTIDTTLNGSTMPFPKGVALGQWLGIVGALGQNGVPAADLSIYQPRNNASVTAAQVASQAWISSGSQTLYFSFDTPVNAPPDADGGPPNYCGRAVFSDLHVAGDPSTRDTVPPPGGCRNADLSPQEKALEFMLFDLSACVVPDTVAPPPGAPKPPR